MNVISCTTWVKQGVAAANPSKVELTPKELQDIIQQTQADLNELENESDNDENCSDEAKKDAATSKSTLKTDEFDFDKYDDECGDMHWNFHNIASFGKDGKDPFITSEDNDNDSEKEDDIIKSDDNLVLVGHVEAEASILEVFVYNEAEGSFYCHHDILLPSFPLCIEWLNFEPTDPKPANLCAIGSMEPVIEIWDLDVVDCLEPAYKLGRKPNKKKKIKRVGHKDAVLDLAWNQNYTHILASGSVDQTVILWDLENGKCATKLESFNEKVQSLKWHPTETHHLLTGCADKMVRLFDCREEKNVKSWQVSGEVERVLWNHFDTNYCIASTDNGYVEYIDIRNDQPIWKVCAHEKEVTGLSLSPYCQGLLISCANDGIVKVWDIINNEPQIVWEKKTNLGALQCLATNPNNSFVFAVGGDNKAHNFKVMDLREVSEVYEIFKGRLSDSQAISKTVKEKKQEEMMEVTEDMESMILDAPSSSVKTKKKKKNKNKNTY